jgi:seryl-tRNA synthetase
MIARMETSKTLSGVDDAALYQYVELYAETEAIKVDHQRIRALSSKLMKSVRTLKGSDLVDAVKEIVKLEFVLSKQSTQLRQGHMAVRQYLIEFGMTPSARTRVKIPAGTEKPKSKLVAFTGGKQA